MHVHISFNLLLHVNHVNRRACACALTSNPLLHVNHVNIVHVHVRVFVLLLKNILIMSIMYHNVQSMCTCISIRIFIGSKFDTDNRNTH